jgi:hypothetical protein
MTDHEIYAQVRADALAGAGGMIAVRFLIGMLDALHVRFGANFSVDGAIEALDRAVTIAEILKDDLRKAKESTP